MIPLDLNGVVAFCQRWCLARLLSSFLALLNEVPLTSCYLADAVNQPLHFFHGGVTGAAGANQPLI